MVDYNKVSVIVSDSQLNKLKSAVENQTGITLRISVIMLDGNNLLHELLLSTRQEIKN